MNFLLSLFTALALSGGAEGGVQALPQTKPELPPRRIEITLSDGQSPNVVYDGENGTENDRDKSHRFPVRRPDTREEGDADDLRYLEKKRELDARFKLMFDLKRELDISQSIMSSKWEEYYALSSQYNEELQKLIASWATDKTYEGMNTK